MFDIGWPEIAVVLIVALLVIGPRDLPKAFHTVGKWVRAARRVTADFQRHIDDMMRETELEDLRKVASQARSLNVKKQIENVIDPGGDLKGAFDVGASEGAKPTKPAATPGAPVKPESAVEAKADTPAAAPAPEKPAPKAPAKPRKSAAKSTPRVPSRVPKRSGSGAGRTAADKAPVSKSNT